MKNNLGRIARSALAPRAVILGVSAFQFGLSLSECMRPGEGYSNHHEEFAELFLASTILAAAACLAAKGMSGNLLAAFLCGPLPLIQAFIFVEAARRAGGWPLGGAHIKLWARELAPNRHLVRRPRLRDSFDAALVAKTVNGRADINPPPARVAPASRRKNLPPGRSF